MKTHNGHFSNIITPLVQWRRLGDLLRAAIRGSELWLLDQLWHGVLLQATQMKKTLRVLADKEVRAGLLAVQALALSVTASRRIYAGLGFVGIVTPLASCAYQLFDQGLIVRDWYHINNFYLFMLLGPYLSGLALTIGVFLLFPTGVKRSFTLLIPAAYFIGKIIWLYQTESNKEYWSVPSWSFFAVGLLISCVIFFLIEWFAHRQFHGKDSFNARVKSLGNVVDEEAISDAKFRSMFRQTFYAKENFKSQY